MNHLREIKSFDSLYGDIVFSEPLASLIKLPVMQRLRHVRLSNIDSLSLPGISGISRYEHAVGVGYLCLNTSIIHSITEEKDRLCFLAASLLHDSAITPYGHLVEEAMQYGGENVDHEARWAVIRSDKEIETGGVDLQIYCGRESGLRKWAFNVFKEDFEQALDLIFNIINGKGGLGRCVKGDVDLDNLDNVVRAAYHMGIEVDRELPIRIAKGMSLSKDKGTLIFSRGVVEELKAWLELRRNVYNRFMLSEADFAGKIMLIAATVSALKSNVLHREDWKLSDTKYMEKLCSCKEKTIQEPVKRWLLGDLWSLSKLIWFKGKRPDYKDLQKFSSLLSKELNRECVAYGIQDKRTREILLNLSDKSSITLGSKSDS
ncbi:MAG: hypothetical protein H8D67_10980, partial [Deltaproteobacteria bacterium]|nr:hypothetical protein [Deltaproteobacteria bacterium]